MNLVAYWQDQIELWNTDNKCGLCWSFGAPLTESAAHIWQPRDGEECCVQVLLLRDRRPAFNTVRNYNNQTGLLLNITCNTNFDILFLIPKSIGLNNYNEIKGHPTTDSKWDTALYLLENCLKCDLELDFCTILGTQYRVMNWSAMQVINWGDHQYTGYRLSVSFQNIA